MSYFGIPLRNGVGLGLGATTGLRNAAINAGASLSLNFQSATLDSRITFTRSTTGTFTGSNGLIQSAAINAPRFDYDPITLACKGLLIEEQRVNLLTYSEQFDNAAWITSNTTITANTTTAPNGGNTAYSFIPTTATTTHNIKRDISSSATNTGSWFVKPTGAYTKVAWFEGTNTGDYVVFDLSGAGSIISTNNATGVVSRIANGWYRINFSASNNPGALSFALFAINPSYTTGAPNLAWTPNGVDGFYIWGAQLEAGAFATSYIPTVASQVTRTADNASMTGTNFSSWYNQSEGTFSTEWTPYVTGNFNAFSATDGTTLNRIQVTGNNAFQFLVGTGGVLQALLDAGTVNASTANKVAGAYRLNDFAASLNSSSVATDTSGTVPTVTRFDIGNLATNTEYINGTIKSISYYPRRLTNAELQAITA